MSQRTQKRTQKPIRSDMGWSTADSITVCGLDLASEILGKMSLADMAWLEIKGAKPNAQQSVVFNALLCTLVEHGITPMALATRLVYLGAPESSQAAIAAGLCGLGSTFAGTAEGAARLLQSVLGTTATPKTAPDLAATARDIVAEHRARKAIIPGIGHPIHKPVDPRTPRLFAIAKENGYAGPYVELMQLIQQEAERVSGKVLPLNATGAMGAILCELDIDWRLARGIAVIGRAVGLVGHIAEELRNPIAAEIWGRIEEEAGAHARPA
ncbi:MAG: citryl-CoA lyase [Burkholderiales bacterium]